MDHDRYHDWLKIPPGARPPAPHTLLGLPGPSASAAQIDAAAHRQLARLDVYAQHAHPAVRDDATRLMNEVARARNTLRNGAAAPPAPQPAATAQPPGRRRWPIAGAALLIGIGLFVGVQALLKAPPHAAPTPRAPHNETVASGGTDQAVAPDHSTSPGSPPPPATSLTTPTPRPADAPPLAPPQPADLAESPVHADAPLQPPAHPPAKTATPENPLPAEHLGDDTTPALPPTAAEDLVTELTTHAPAAPTRTARLELAYRLARELHDHLAEQERPDDLRTSAELALVFAQTGDHQRAEPLLKTSLDRVLASLAREAQGVNRPDRVPSGTRHAFTALVHAHAALGTTDSLNTRLLQEPTPVVYLAVTQLAPRSDRKPRKPSFVLPTPFQTPLIPVVIELAAPADGARLSLFQAERIADLLATQNANPTQIQTFLNRLPEQYHEYCRRQVIETLLDNQQSVKALTLLEGDDSSRGNRDSDHAVLLAAALAASGDTERAFQVAKRLARRAIDPTKLAPEDSRTRLKRQLQYLQLAATFHQCGRAAEAKKMWESAAIAALNTGQLGTVIDHLVTHQQADLAHQLIIQQDDASERESMALFLLRTLDPSLSDAQFSTQLRHIPPTFEGARHLLGLWRSVRHDQPALGERFLMTTARRFSALDQASATTGGERDEARNVLARSLCLALAEFGDIEQATRIAQTLPQDVEKYLARILAYAAVHLPLDELVHQAKQITDPGHQQTMVEDAMRYLVRDGDFAKAQAFATETAEVIDGLNSYSRARFFRRLFDASIEHRSWDSAARHLAEVTEPGFHRSLATTVAHVSIQQREADSIALIPVLLGLASSPQTTHLPLALALLEPLDGDQTLAFDLPDLEVAGQESPPSAPEPITGATTTAAQELIAQLTTSGGTPLSHASRYGLARRLTSEAHAQLAPGIDQAPLTNAALLGLALARSGDPELARSILNPTLDRTLETLRPRNDAPSHFHSLHAVAGPDGPPAMDALPTLAHAYAALDDLDRFSDRLQRESPAVTIGIASQIARHLFPSAHLRSVTPPAAALRPHDAAILQASLSQTLVAALGQLDPGYVVQCLDASVAIAGLGTPIQTLEEIFDRLPEYARSIVRPLAARALTADQRHDDAARLQAHAPPTPDAADQPPAPPADPQDPDHLAALAVAHAARDEAAQALALADTLGARFDTPAVIAHEDVDTKRRWRDRYLRLAEVYTLCARPAEARTMWGLAAQVARHLTPSPDSPRLAEVLTHVLQHADAAQADRVLSREIDRDQRDQLVALLLRTVGTTLTPREATAHLRGLQPTHDNAERLLNLYQTTGSEHAELRTGYLDAATERFGRAERRTRGRATPAEKRQHDHLAERLARALAESGDLDRATRLVRHLDDPSTHTVANLMGHAALHESVADLIQRLKSIQDQTVQRASIRRAVEQLGNHGEIDKAQDLLDRTSQALTPDDRLRTGAVLTAACVEAARWDDAHKRLDALATHTHLDIVVRAIAHAAATGSDPGVIPLVEAVFDKSPDPGQTRITFALALSQSPPDPNGPGDATPAAPEPAPSADGDRAAEEEEEAG